MRAKWSLLAGSYGISGNRETRKSKGHINFAFGFADLET